MNPLEGLNAYVPPPSFTRTVQLCYDCGGDIPDKDVFVVSRSNGGDNFGHTTYANQTVHADRRVCVEVRKQKEMQRKIALDPFYDVPAW